MSYTSILHTFADSDLRGSLMHVLCLFVFPFLLRFLFAYTDTPIIPHCR